MRVEILIRKIRKERNIKLEDLARISGISKGTLSKIERQELKIFSSFFITVSIVLFIQ